MNTKDKKIGIIGLGYVGLPLAINFGKVKNFKVYGFDIDKKKIRTLEIGKSYISHINSNDIKKFINKNKVFSDFEKISEVDFILLCLPTPLKKGNKPDLSYIVDTINKIFPYLKKGQALSLESSTYPGTTEEVVIKKLKKKFKIGKNFSVIYSPEREDPGNKIKMEMIPKVVAGYSAQCLIKGKYYYSKVFKKIVLVNNLKTAEFSKILENVFRSINIGLVNEIKIIADKMGIDIFDIIKTASSKPFGFMPFYPGPGVGGHCIPLDPFYLTWRAKKFGAKTKFIELAHQVNTDMKNWIINKIKIEMKQISKKKILVIGVAYKKNIDDCRESPSLEIISGLKMNNVKVDYHDPYVAELPLTRKYNFKLKSIPINYKNLKTYDAVLILTDHSKVNYSLIKKFSKKIFDSRGVYSPVDKKIIRV